MENTLGGIYGAEWGTVIYAGVAAICLGNVGLSWIMAVASRQKVWSAYSAVMLLISLVTIVFALLHQPVAQAAGDDGVDRVECGQRTVHRRERTDEWFV